ncbi:MAG: preprotein translocase subunit YajC [Spirochaetales bacterium]|nr:preprotein translocase subunit YajC [Spirochaetales bacterium]
MDKLFLSLPLLQGAPGADSTTSLVTTVLMMAAVFAVFYFLIIRPQRKKQKELKKMLDELKKGDKVTTIGGIRGVIQDVKEKTIVLKVDDNTKIEFNKDAVSRIANKSENSDESNK